MTDAEKVTHKAKKKATTEDAKYKSDTEALDPIAASEKLRKIKEKEARDKLGKSTNKPFSTAKK
jgi:hypothetical protein|tara:strand:- start:282 stop:473 length:192 start_codon:yes stop_codon:yes gene_type:complete